MLGYFSRNTVYFPRAHLVNERCCQLLVGDPGLGLPRVTMEGGPFLR